MDPADTETENPSVHKALSSQGQLLGQHQLHIRTLTTSNQALGAQVAQLQTQIAQLSTHPYHTPQQPAPDSPTPPRESYVPDPEPFYRELEKCQKFLFQCFRVFDQRPVTFATYSSKIHYIMGLLRGRALSWVEATYSQYFVSTLSLRELCSRLQEVFNHLEHSGNAAKRLLRLRQGQRSVADFSIDFWTLVADSQWNDAALRGLFVDCLSEQLSKTSLQLVMNLLILMLLFPSQSGLITG